jgi:hypothetical protein
MSWALFLLALGFVARECIKAAMGVRLLEKDPEAWEKLVLAERERVRCRQEALGKTLLQVIRFVSSFSKKNEGEQ